MSAKTDAAVVLDISESSHDLGQDEEEGRPEAGKDFYINRGYE